MLSGVSRILNFLGFRDKTNGAVRTRTLDSGVGASIQNEVKVDIKEPLLSATAQITYGLDADTFRSPGDRREPGVGPKGPKERLLGLRPNPGFPSVTRATLSKPLSLMQLNTPPPTRRSAYCPLTKHLIVLPVTHKREKTRTYDYKALYEAARQAAEEKDEFKVLSIPKEAEITARCAQSCEQMFKQVGPIKVKKRYYQRLYDTEMAELENANDEGLITVTVDNIAKDWEIDWEYIRKRNILLEKHGHTLENFLALHTMTRAEYEEELLNLKIEMVNWDEQSGLTDKLTKQLRLLPITDGVDTAEAGALITYVSANQTLRRTETKENPFDEKEALIAEQKRGLEEKSRQNPHFQVRVTHPFKIAGTLSLEELRTHWKIDLPHREQRDAFLQSKGITPEQFYKYRGTNAQKIQKLIQEYKRWFKYWVQVEQLNFGFDTPQQHKTKKRKLLLWLAFIMLTREIVSLIANLLQKDYTFTMVSFSYYLEFIYPGTTISKRVYGWLSSSMETFSYTLIDNQVFNITTSLTCRNTTLMAHKVAEHALEGRGMSYYPSFQRMNFAPLFGSQTAHPLLTPVFIRPEYVAGKPAMNCIFRFLIDGGLLKLFDFFVKDKNFSKSLVFIGTFASLTFLESFFGFVRDAIVGDDIVKGIIRACNYYSATSLTTGVSVSMQETEYTPDLLMEAVLPMLWILFLMSFNKMSLARIDQRSPQRQATLLREFPPPIINRKYWHQYDFDADEPENLPVLETEQPDDDFEFETEDDSGSRCSRFWRVLGM